MAEVLGIQPRSMARWSQNQQGDGRSRRRPPGRPPVLPSSVAWKVRERYLASYGQWGPQVLACWAERQGLGHYSPSTLAKAIADLRPEPPPKLTPLRYDVTAPGVMWSEDGAGFRDHGRKRELLLINDECSRLKVGHELCAGPATGEDVARVLRGAFERHGAPLVLKRDGGSIFDEESVRGLLEEYGVVALTSPPATPRYNGRAERAFRDVRGYERAIHERGEKVPLGQRIDRAIHDLNEERPRPVLGGRTAREIHETVRCWLPDRARFRREVERRTQERQAEATSRHERDRASRRAIEEVLSSYGLVTWKGDVSTDSRRETGTK